MNDTALAIMLVGTYLALGKSEDGAFSTIRFIFPKECRLRL